MPEHRAHHAAAFYAAYYAVLGSLLPFLGPYLAGRGIDAAAIGWLMAELPLVRAIYTPLAGGLADRGRWRRGWLALHLLVAAAAMAVLPVTSGIVTAALCIAVLGCGHGAVLPLVEARLLAGSLRRRYGPIRLWGSIAFIAVASAAGPLIARWPAAAVPVITALLLVVAAVTALPFELSPRRREPSSEPNGVGRRVWLLLGVLALNQVAHGPYYALLSVDLERHGWSASAIGITWSAGVAAETLLFAFGSLLTRRYRLEGLLSAALVLTPLRWLAFALPPSLLSVTCGHMGHAFGFALAHLAGVQLVQQYAPAAARQRAQALYSGLVFGLGIAAGSAGAGMLYTAVGGRLMFLTAALLSTGLLVPWLLFERRYRSISF